MHCFRVVFDGIVNFLSRIFLRILAVCWGSNISEETEWEIVKPDNTMVSQTVMANSRQQATEKANTLFGPGCEVIPKGYLDEFDKNIHINQTWLR